MSLSSASSACWAHRPCNEIQGRLKGGTAAHTWAWLGLWSSCPELAGAALKPQALTTQQCRLGSHSSMLASAPSSVSQQGLAVEQLKLDCGNDSFKIALQVFLKIHLLFFFFFLVSLIPASDSPDCTGTPTGSIRVCALTQSASRGLGGAGRAAEIMAAWFTQMLSPTWRVHLCVWLQ